jgi:hypothetical protein
MDRSKSGERPLFWFFKILKSSANFLLNFKFLMLLMWKYIQLTMLISYFLQIVRAFEYLYENQSAASLLLSYYRKQLEIVQYIFECRQLIFKLLGRTIWNCSLYIRVPLANTWNIKDLQIPLNILLKFTQKNCNIETLFLAYLRLF